MKISFHQQYTSPKFPKNAPPLGFTSSPKEKKQEITAYKQSSHSISHKSVLVFRIGPGNQNISVRYEIDTQNSLLSQIV